MLIGQLSVLALAQPYPDLENTNKMSPGCTLVLAVIVALALAIFARALWKKLLDKFVKNKKRDE